MRVREDGVWYYEVNKFSAIVENVIPFFDRFGFLSSKKKRDFAKFVQISILMRNGEHLTELGIQRLLRIREDMNDGGAGRRKYTDDEIMFHLQSGKSSGENYTPTRHSKKTSEDIVPSAWRHAGTGSTPPSGLRL